jgi:SAM-dependent methyltransferase
LIFIYRVKFLGDNKMSPFNRLFFNFHYLGKPRWDTGISPPELLEFIEQHAPGRGLDLGCGTGTNAITLAKAGWQVTGVDFIGRAVQTARQKARQAGAQITFLQGDVTPLPNLSGPFDLILDIGCFHSLAPQGKAAYVENLERWLAPQGAY